MRLLGKDGTNHEVAETGLKSLALSPCLPTGQLATWETHGRSKAQGGVGEGRSAGQVQRVG